MDITYLGQASFKIRGRTASVVIDPVKSIEADIIVPGPIVAGPGEYEIKGISILGFKNAENTIFVYEVDGMRICYLKNVDQNVSDTMIESLGDIDILLISVGGKAAEIITNIEPTITIPMNFDSPEEFIKQVGMAVERLPKLLIKKEELGENQKVVVLDRK